MKTIEEINQHNVKKILSEKKIPDFFPGDVVKVGVRITEGKKERMQYFEGVCIAKKSRDLNSSFTVRKISFGEGVERTFPPVSYTHLRAHETKANLVCRLLLEKKKHTHTTINQ